MVSTDEACPNYSDVLRNFEAGHSFVMSEFGVTPKIAWQLDPFGHSSGLADLFAEIGFEATFFARINSVEESQLRLERDLEFIWKPTFVDDEDDGTHSDGHKEILAHKLFGHYNPPKFINPNFVSGNPSGYEYSQLLNNSWFEYFTRQAEAYQTNNVLVFWGDDFTHMYANSTFSYLEKTIKGLEGTGKELFNLKWSSISEYLKSVFAEA